MERVRSHEWLKRYSVPAHWREVRRDEHGVVFDDQRPVQPKLDPQVAAHVARQMGGCAGCGG